MVSLTAHVPRTVGPSAPKRPKNPSARSAASRKRTNSQAGMEIDVPGTADGVLQSPSKKPKVQFDPDVEVYPHHSDSPPTDLLREQVSRALIRHKNLGDSTEISTFKRIFVDDGFCQAASDVPSREDVLQALIRMPNSLDNSAADLVSAILNSNWITQDVGYVDLFHRFVVCLISARSAWTSSVLETLVEKFSKPLPSGAADSRISRKEAEQRIHRLIAQIVEISPLDGTVSLKHSLAKSFPSAWDSSKKHILYVHNLLKVIGYTPQLEHDILALVTDRIVKIDVQVQTDTEDIEDLDELLFGEDPEQLDSFVDSLEDESDDETDDEINMTEGSDPQQTAKQVKRELQKLDILLDIVFEYHTRSIDASGVLSDDVYELLESHFDNIILPAYRSRHTQFLIFHFAQSSVEYIDRFVGDCLVRVMDRNRSAMVRHSAAAYLASFVARGARVPAQIVRDVFGYIGDTLTSMREEYEPKCDGRPDLRRFGVYYSLVQALLYIFCFRWRDLEVSVSDPGSSPEPYNSATVIHDHEITQRRHHSFVPKLRETICRNVLSPLNPLKICAPVITEEFARIASDVGVVWVYDVIEDNKHIRLVQTNTSVLGRESALNASKDQSMLQLDAYFPFDPYNLPRSKRWLVGDYRAWQGTTSGEDEESNSEAGSDDEEIDDDDGPSDQDQDDE